MMDKQILLDSDMDRDFKIVIVGGGLVGSLAALHLAKRGYEVHLYEYREDIRTAKHVVGRSINLALSARGRKALAEVDLENVLLNHGIPMKGRMLHDVNGGTRFVPYDPNTNQCIYSVGRKHLNEILLSAAEKLPNINLNFNQKLISVKLKSGELTFLNPQTNQQTEVYADLVIGCDGAYSTVRKNMLHLPGFEFSQTYIEHGYLELCILPENGECAMPQNYLHIWPRGKFMLIALPNQDKSWTVTLFMPFSNFNRINTNEKLIEFFQMNFPDAIALIGREKLLHDFFKTKPQHLVSIKCRPYNFNEKALLLGDAAHAMVPFFGQGMNCGFEDCSILTDILTKHNNNINIALAEFSAQRWENAHTICDLAMYNYVEMRDLVTRKSYRIRKFFDDLLYWLMPNQWIPLYNSVSFSTMPYKQCLENRKWQNKVLRHILLSVTILGGGLSISYFVNKVR